MSVCAADPQSLKTGIAKRRNPITNYHKKRRRDSFIDCCRAIWLTNWSYIYTFVCFALALFNSTKYTDCFQKSPIHKLNSCFSSNGKSCVKSVRISSQRSCLDTREIRQAASGVIKAKTTFCHYNKGFCETEPLRDFYQAIQEWEIAFSFWDISPNSFTFDNNYNSQRFHARVHHISKCELNSAFCYCL